MKVAIFVSSYKSSNTLPMVIDRIPAEVKKIAKEIFVIDDASPDNSYLVAVQYKNKAKLPNLKVMKNMENLGFGGNQKEAYKYAIKKGYDVLVVLHGDAQYAPEEIPKLLEGIKRTDADLVFGSRMLGEPLGGGMPLWRFVGNRLLTFIQNLVLGLGLSEYHSGFRAYKCKALASIPFEKISSDYYFDPEILVLFKIKNFKIAEVPIPTHYGPESLHPSTYATLKYFLFTLKSLLDYELHIRGIKGAEKYTMG